MKLDHIYIYYIFIYFIIYIYYYIYIIIYILYIFIICLFMDTQISLSSNNDFFIITNVCRKPTDTKTIVNFHAVCPWIWKSGLINNNNNNNGYF